ncbi:heavy metal translocating P-type ATPase [Hathewaya limosa]|uniref:Cd(2+)-exporting ATPase n=1 Tax=Hathewaya limosa TaxID=1536 RepID=A0ABU0JQD5_HATLI|nr:heavy metal translocating P-type ATPase [Hathewaya limosa]MDQ0478645.1 cation-transporting P-type ATPase C [Hathewaya limosa]
MILKKKIPLLKPYVVHSLPGRVRIGCRALKYLSQYKIDIEKKFSDLRVIKSIEVNCITKNSLICYEQNLINQDEVLKIFEEIISYYSLVAYKEERKESSLAMNYNRELEEVSVGEIVKRVGVTLGVIGYSFWKKRKASQQLPLSLYKRFTTLPALMSIYLTKPLFKSGIGSLTRNFRPNADTLTITSIAASLLTGKDVSALTIILLSDIAEFMTSYTMKKTRDSIRNMMNLNEEYVWKQLNDGTVRKEKIDNITKGDTIVVHAGEKICVDGTVISGEAVVDQSAVTGEFMPEIKRKDNKVFAGTVLKNGIITVSTEKAGDDTVVSRIISLVEDAAYQKANIQNYADKFSAYLIPFNFMFAGITYIVTKSPIRALNMLVIDYSCGIKLSTVTAFSAAINTAVKGGVLIKGGNYIENLSEADTLILDKTGTLTEGKPEIVDIITASGYEQTEILQLAGAAEETSGHPMAMAVLSKVKSKGLSIPKHGEVITHIARGVETKIDDDIIRVGSEVFLTENNVDISELKDRSDAMKAKGKSLIYISKNEKIIGLIGIEDKMRDNMKKSLNNLRYQGINEIMLLTGDLEKQAQIVSDKMGVDSYEAELLPEDKAKAVLKLQANGSKVIMVGDGVNDAPALAYSDVGIALGGRTTDVAMETSDVTVQGDDPMKLPIVMDLSKKTMNIVKQNFGLVITINSLGLLLSAVGVLPVFWGAVLHNSSTIFVVSNSLRLLFFNMERGT